MRAQALTIPRALMLFSALLMAILIVRIVGYHYSVSDKQQTTFRFMLSATDIAKKLSSSSECLSRPLFVDRRVFDLQKIEEFNRNYSNIEPECAYDYHLGWHAKVIERPFSYISPALITKTEFGQDNSFNCSNLVLMSKNQLNLTITNYTHYESNSTSVLVEKSYFYPYNQIISFNSSFPVWAISQNYGIKTPRHSTPVAVFSKSEEFCIDPYLEEFPITRIQLGDLNQTNFDQYPVLVFLNISELSSSQVDILNQTISNHTTIAITENETFLGFPPGLHPACDNCTGAIFMDHDLDESLSDIIDMSRGRGPNDLISFYGLQFLTYIPSTLWVLPPYDTNIQINDLSTGDDNVELFLDQGESRALTGFDSDIVEIKSDRPVWAITGDRGGFAWLQSRSITFPSFGNFSIIAEEDSNLTLKVLDEGDYISGPQYQSNSYNLSSAEQVFYNNTNTNGYRWVSLNSTGLVTILTWSDHGLIQRESAKSGDGRQLRTNGAGQVIVCGDDINVNPALPMSLVHSNCYRVEPRINQTVTFTSNFLFNLYQSLGGDEAEQPLTSYSGDDPEAVAIADFVNATMAPPYASLSQHNLFYIYRSSPNMNLPSFQKGLILLYNEPEVFSSFGLRPQPVDLKDCKKWTTSSTPVFSTPHNITSQELASYPYQGCTYWHWFSGLSSFAVNNEKDLRTIAGFTYTSDLLAAASIRPLHSSQMRFVGNLGHFVGDHIFMTSNQTEWEFGASDFSYGSTKTQQIQISLPISIYHNTTDVRPGQLELTVVDGELETVAGMIDSVCKDNQTIIQEMSVTYPFSAPNRELCQADLVCRPIHCERNIFISLEPGFRIVKAASNETGIFVI